jgi:hypothetical protein
VLDQYMNLSHYERMDLHVTHGPGQKCVETCDETCPAHHHAPVLPLNPGTRPLPLGARHVRFQRPPPRVAVPPHPCGQLGPEPPSAEALPEVWGVIALIPRQHLEALTRAAACASAAVADSQPRQDWSPLVPMGRRRARGPWPARPVREAMAEKPVAVAARGAPFTAARARGQKRHPPHQTAPESSRVLRPAPAAGLAWPRGCHRPAPAAAPWGPRGRSHQRQPVRRRASTVVRTCRKDVGGRPRPRVVGSGGKRAANSFHSQALHPSTEPALGPAFYE